MRVKRIAFLAVGLSLFTAQVASAQTGGAGNRAAAEALFNEGRKLAASGKYADACPKFEASQKLDPGLGTLLNLAECYEKIGKTASAWAEYREAIPLARASGSKDARSLLTLFAVRVTPRVDRARRLQQRDRHRRFASGPRARQRWQRQRRQPQRWRQQQRRGRPRQPERGRERDDRWQCG